MGSRERLSAVTHSGAGGAAMLGCVIAGGRLVRGFAAMGLVRGFAAMGLVRGFAAMGLVRGFGAIVTVITFTLLAMWAKPARASYDAQSADWDGLSQFVQLAKDEAGATEVVLGSHGQNALDYGALRPKDAVILLHPESSLDIESLSRFLRDGGRVVLFDDFGTGDELLRHFQIRRLGLPAHPALELRQNPALAIAEPFSPGDHQTVRGVSRVVLNHASGVDHKELSPLLFVRSADDGEKVLVGLAGAVDKGHLLVVSDSSVPINGMLRFTGNRAFVRNVLRYAHAGLATGGPSTIDGAGGGKIFIEVGAFDQIGAYGDASESSSVGKLRFLTDAFHDFERNGLPPAVAYLAAGFLALALGAWVYSRASRVHRARAPRYTKPIPLAVQGGVAGHAAVIAAKGTTRALAVLEIKSALEEEICDALALERAPAPDELVAAAKGASLLSDASGRTLRDLLAYMGRVETLVLSRRAEAMKQVRDADVVRCANQARAIVDEMRARHRGEAASL